MIKYPYNDNSMIYDFKKHRYILTLDYVKNVLGIDIEARLSANNTVNATTVFNSFLDNVSIQVYNYLYQYNNSKIIQWIIAKHQSARDIILEAMRNQILYVIYNGDMGFSTKKEEQEVSLNIYAKQILDTQEVCETVTTLTYVGNYPFWAPCYEYGEY